MKKQPAKRHGNRPLRQENRAKATSREVEKPPPPTPQTELETRLERIAAIGRKLSRLVEKNTDRPFGDAIRQLSVEDQEIFEQAVTRREWSELFLSPLAQKVARATRAANRPPVKESIGAARRRRSAAKSRQ